MLIRMKKVGLCLLGLIVASSVDVSAKEVKDHPLISRFKNSTVKDHKEYSHYKIKFPVAAVKADGTSEWLSKEGKASFYRYTVPEKVSVHELAKSYEVAFDKANLEIVFQCSGSDCGQGMAKYIELNPDFNGKISYSYDGTSPIYLVKHQNSDTSTYIFVSLYEGYYNASAHHIILTEEAMRQDSIAINADFIQEKILSEGKIVLDGIFFDSNSKTIKSESKKSLNEIAKFLKQNKSMNFYVVGHTDGDGSERFNLDLSQARATSVVNALTEGYKIRKEQLKARGVGDWVPVATNKSEKGRAKNRRVELVKI
ncbi:OmpA family protein [Pleionea sp. CnH1-48]|uniref:OmpA family protein n=1 Tax=Pleionea sp. CnH1-48 TaxID=2954494 RepID=UPI0020979E0A|nr:OmpA family protein [Pleionea sp. CnH1-48]MCO7223847.1 OmpA family protein [Pleionea sp. CnH1-48]